MFQGFMDPNPQSKLQSTIAAATSTGESLFVGAHHPITCTAGRLSYEDGGLLRCDHAVSPAGDKRSIQAVNHSVALLLVELAMELY